MEVGKATLPLLVQHPQFHEQTLLCMWMLYSLSTVVEVSSNFILTFNGNFFNLQMPTATRVSSCTEWEVPSHWTPTRRPCQWDSLLILVTTTDTRMTSYLGGLHGIRWVCCLIAYRSGYQLLILLLISRKKTLERRNRADYVTSYAPAV